MADNKQAKTEEYQPGTVDEGSHGWAPDAPGSGEAAERVTEANQKAWEARDTQEEAAGPARQGPDLPGGNGGGRGEWGGAAGGPVPAACRRVHRTRPHRC